MRSTGHRTSTLIVSLAFCVVWAGCGGGGGSSSPPPNHAPTANAGNAVTVQKRATVTLDGSGSSDTDGDTLTYSWTQTAGPTATLSSSSAAKPTFTSPGASGTLTFSLVVNDGKVDSSAATVVVTVENHAPVASAPAVGSVAFGSAFVLDGSASSDPDNDPLTYTWTQTAGPTVTLSGASTSRAGFTAPTVPTALTFSLVVNDGEVDSAAVTEVITVQATAPPTASAGSDTTVPKRATIDLVGSGTSATGTPLSFAWTQTSGTTVTLQNPTSATPSFTTPAVAGDLVFSLVVSDSFASSAPSTVTVHVKNYAPTVSAVALTPSSPKRANAITASATASDPDSDPLTTTYVWKRNGTTVASATSASYPLGNQAKNDVISVAVTTSDGQLSATSTASVTIADTPAVLSGTPPTTVAYGSPVSFQVTAADADGDPTGPLEVAYGPAGFSVTTAGLVTWTPSGPMFETSVPMSWGVRLKNTPSVQISGVTTVTDAARLTPIMRSNAGIPINGNTIEVQDFNGTGSKQVLVASRASIYLLAKSVSGYAQSWAYPFDAMPGSSISASTSGDVDGDGHREIFFAAGPVIIKLDGVTRRETGRFGVAVSTSTAQAGPYCTALRYADIDADGKGELVCLGTDAQSSAGSRLYVIDAATMQLKWQTAALSLGTSLAIANVDADPDLELITNGGYVFDGSTHANKWAYGPGFGSIIDVGDVSGDGVAKIVGVANGNTINVYDAVLKSPVWYIDLTSDISGISALRVADLDGAAPAEIITGDAQWGNVNVFRYSTSTHIASKIATIPVPGDGVSGIAAGDVNGDGVVELVYGSDYYSSGRDFIDVASWTPTPMSLWSGPLPDQLDGPFYCARLATIATGRKTLLFSTPQADSGYAGTRVISLDPVTAAFQTSTEVDSNWSHNGACDVGPVLGNGLDQVLLGTATLYTNYFTAFDFASSTKLWTSGTVGGAMAVTHADLNGDGVPDVVGLSGDGHLYVWDAAHSTLLWSGAGFNGGTAVSVADLDGDGIPEIVVLASDRVIVYAGTPAAGYLERASYAISGVDLLVADTDGDSRPEIYVLAGSPITYSSTVYQLDHTLTPLNSFSVPLALNIYLEQSSSARKNLVVATGGSYPVTGGTVKIVDATNGTEIWEAPALAGTVSRGSLNFYDLSGSGQLQMAFGTSVGMFFTR